MYFIRRTQEYYALSVLFHDAGLEVKIQKEIPQTALKLWECLNEEEHLIAGCQLGMRSGHYVLESLAVENSYRGTGIGKELLNLAEKEAMSMGAQEIWLVAKVPEYYEKFDWLRISSKEAPDISKCLHCGQFEKSCFPAIMRKRLS